MGSIDELREWDATYALALTKIPLVDWWRTQVDIPIGNTIEYKFAIRSQSGSLRWEGGPNRLDVIPDSISHVFWADFGKTTGYVLICVWVYV